MKTTEEEVDEIKHLNGIKVEILRLSIMQAATFNELIEGGNARPYAKEEVAS